MSWYPSGRRVSLLSRMTSGSLNGVQDLTARP